MSSKHLLLLYPLTPFSQMGTIFDSVVAGKNFEKATRREVEVAPSGVTEGLEGPYYCTAFGVFLSPEECRYNLQKQVPLQTRTLVEAKSNSDHRH